MEKIAPHPVEPKAETPKVKTRENIHKGHRTRLRDRYSQSGLDDFAPHEMLELLLTYCIPQKDVNGYAHALIDRFGSFSGALDASPSELQTVPGIGPEAARYLTMLPAVFRYYAMDKSTPREPMDTMAKLSRYLHTLFVGLTRERVYMLLLDNSMCLIECCHLTDGSVNCSSITVRRVIEETLFHRASAVVLAHNHPNGLAIPSAADREVTEHLSQALELIQVPLVEHIIVTENSCGPILLHQKGLLRASPGQDGGIDEAFYRTFYGEATP